MIHHPSFAYWTIAPELTLVAAALVTMLLSLAPKRAQQVLLPLIALGGLVTTIVFACLRWSHPMMNAFAGQLDADQTAQTVRILASSAGIVAVLASIVTRDNPGSDAEHYTLLLTAVAGMGLFGAAGSFVTLFVGLELFSLSLYVLCALDTERASSLEAGLKYLIVGGLGSAFLLYGLGLVYGATGSFSLADVGSFGHRGALLDLGCAMVLAALAFKASLAPLHWWTPDVYDGAPTTITSFMAVGTKVAAFLAIARVMVVAFHADAHIWQPIVAAIAVASIVIGNLGAVVQDRLKRMLAYSSVAQAGYLLIGLVAWKHLGLTALTYGLVAYSATTLGAFTLIIMREHVTGEPVTYDSLAGTGWAGKSATTWIAALPGIAMVICILSLSGIPPMSGFFMKFGLFDAAVQAHYTWLALIGVIGSLVSLGYYLRVLVAMYMRPAAEAAAVRADAASRRTGVRGLAALGVVLAALVLIIGFTPNRIIDRACTSSLELTRGFYGGADCSSNTLAARR